MSLDVKNKKLLVVVAHPDDEVLGIGGMIHRFVHMSGCEARAVMLTDGESSRSPTFEPEHWAEAIATRRQQAQEAMACVGYASYAFYDFPDNRMDTVSLLDIVKVVEQEKTTFQPDIVFTHHQGDLNIDHRRTYEAVMTAFRPLPTEHPVSILTFETPSSTEWQATDAPAFEPTVFLQLGEADLEAKLAGVAAYTSELRPFPHPRSQQALRLLAQRWGVVSGLGLAEPLCVKRLIQPVG